jgi:hypothetical protein
VRHTVVADHKHNFKLTLNIANVSSITNTQLIGTFGVK